MDAKEKLNRYNIKSLMGMLSKRNRNLVFEIAVTKQKSYVSEF